VDAQGEMLQLKQTFTRWWTAVRLRRRGHPGGPRGRTEGRLGGQAHVRGVSGVWEDLTVSVNGMATNLTMQVRNISQVATAVAEGDLSQKITVDAQGEVLQLKQTFNTMVGQLSAFATRSPGWPARSAAKAASAARPTSAASRASGRT